MKMSIFSLMGILFLFVPLSVFCDVSPSVFLNKVNEGRLQSAQLTQIVEFFKSNKILADELGAKITGAFIKDLDFDGKRDAVLEMTTLKEHDAPYVQFIFLLSKEKYRYLPSYESFLDGKIIAAAQFNSYYSKHSDLFIANGVKWETDLGDEFAVFHFYPSTNNAFLGRAQNTSLKIPYEWRCSDQDSSEGKRETFIKDIDNDGEKEIFEYQKSKKCKEIRFPPNPMVMDFVSDPKAEYSNVARLFDTLENMTSIKIINTKKEVLSYLEKFKDGESVQNPWLSSKVAPKESVRSTP